MNHLNKTLIILVTVLSIYIYLNGSKLENCSIINKFNYNYFGNISLLFFTFSTKYNLNTCPQINFSWDK
ncbi:hypothetical protein BpHYR1_013026 [Brachionus plicatilis]|uniref:Uncharacterized protein n=1 Tax=Brachionus plicatilis TaxID=10195 RepID=A0A3M7QII6_BRAPC|nr:hypothetical protein BpHYR1_013026 [Brachionus plicatilis]